MSYRLVKIFLRFRNVLQTCEMSYRLGKKRMSCREKKCLGGPTLQNVAKKGMSYRLVECLTDLSKKECLADLWNVLQTCQKRNVLQTWFIKIF